MKPRQFAVASLLLAAISIASNPQETPAARPPPAKTSITGHVYYSDTKAPARLAQVMLLKIAPVKLVPDEKPAAARPGIAAADAAAILNTLATTGLDGHFAMTGVPAGKYVVLVVQNGAINPLSRIDLEALNNDSTHQITEDQIRDYLGYLTVVTVEAGKTPDVAVSLSRGASISGTLNYEDGSPAVGIKIHLLSKTQSAGFDEPNMLTLGGMASNGTLAGFLTDDRGRFRIAGLMPGTYSLRATLPLNGLKNLGRNIAGIMALNASSPGSTASAMKFDDELSIYNGNVFSRKNLKPIELSENQQFTGAAITIPLAGMHSVQARVIDGATGHAVEAAQVRLLDAEGKEILRSAFIDNNGDCTFEYVPEGTYTLRVANAMDVSPAGKMLSKNYDPKKIVRYGMAETTVQVKGDVSGVVLQVAKFDTASQPAQ